MKSLKYTLCAALLVLAMSSAAFANGGTISTTKSGTISTTRTGTISTTGTIPTTRTGIIPTTRTAVPASRLRLIDRLGLLDVFITVLQVW
jgi:hypothetical protein